MHYMSLSLFLSYLLNFTQGLEIGCDFTKDGTVAIVQDTLQAMEGELEKKKKYDVQNNDLSCSFSSTVSFSD